MPNIANRAHSVAIYYFYISTLQFELTTVPIFVYITVFYLYFICLADPATLSSPSSRRINPPKSSGTIIWE